MLALPYSFSLIIHVYILLLFTYHLRPERDYHINPLLNVKFILVCLRWQLKAKHRSIMTRVYNMDLYDPLPLLYQWLHYWTSLTGLSLGRREWNIKDFSSKPGEECLPSVRRQPAVSHSEVGWCLWQFCAGTSLLTLFWTCKWMATWASHAGLQCVLEQVSCFTCSWLWFPTESMVSLQKGAGACWLSMVSDDSTFPGLLCSGYLTCDSFLSCFCLTRR